MFDASKMSRRLRNINSTTLLRWRTPRYYLRANYSVGLFGTPLLLIRFHSIALAAHWDLSAYGHIQSVIRRHERK